MFGEFFDISALQEELNPSIFTWNSVQGVVVLLVIIGIGVCFAKKITKSGFYGFMGLILFQILHVFAMSSLGNQIPILSAIFHYDVFQSLAQLCVGTPVASALLYVQIFINHTFGLAFEMVVLLWQLIKPGFEFVKDSLLQWRN